MNLNGARGRKPLESSGAPWEGANLMIGLGLYGCQAPGRVDGALGRLLDPRQSRPARTFASTGRYCALWHRVSAHSSGDVRGDRHGSSWAVHNSFQSLSLSRSGPDYWSLAIFLFVLAPRLNLVSTIHPCTRRVWSFRWNGVHSQLRVFAAKVFSIHVASHWRLRGRSASVACTQINRTLSASLGHRDRYAGSRWSHP
jgi:hypothetical protein